MYTVLSWLLPLFWLEASTKSGLVLLDSLDRFLCLICTSGMPAISRVLIYINAMDKCK